MSEILGSSASSAIVHCRAREAGATLIERWTSSQRGHSIYYVGDWENNIFGFAPRYHNPKIDVP